MSVTWGSLCGSFQYRNGMDDAKNDSNLQVGSERAHDSLSSEGGRYAKSYLLA